MTTLTWKTLGGSDFHIGATAVAAEGSQAAVAGRNTFTFRDSLGTVRSLELTSTGGTAVDSSATIGATAGHWGTSFWCSDDAMVAVGGPVQWGTWIEGTATSYKKTDNTFAPVCTSTVAAYTAHLVTPAYSVCSTTNTAPQGPIPAAGVSGYLWRNWQISAAGATEMRWDQNDTSCAVAGGAVTETLIAGTESCVGPDQYATYSRSTNPVTTINKLKEANAAACATDLGHWANATAYCSSVLVAEGAVGSIVGGGATPYAYRIWQLTATSEMRRHSAFDNQCS